jgi:HEAT repeat protein/tetratricopeptide (TPR) repeat protein
MPLFGRPDVEKLSRKRDVPGLIKALSYQKDSSVRAAAASELMMFGLFDARPVEPLIAALEDPDWHVRGRAAAALGVFGPGDIRPVAPLIAALRDQNAGVRRDAAWALGLMKDTRATEALVLALRDKNEEVRQTATRALKLHGWQAAETQANASEPESAPAPAPASAPKPKPKPKGTPQVKPIAAPTPPSPQAKANVPPAGQLLNDLRNANDDVRAAAAATLGHFGARAVEPLVGALADSSEAVREAAIHSLGEIGAPGTKALVAGLADADRHVRWRAANALGRIGDPKAGRSLTGALNDSDQYVREAAALALSTLDTPDMRRPAPPVRERVTAQAMASSRTFRVFVSSTFDDFKEERNALQRYVFPRLAELCASRQGRFQAIDLRWGVSEEAGLDQRAVAICLDEIARCQRLTPRPNFIVLLGDRYGWRPLPSRIEKAEFESIRARVPESAGAESDRALLDLWYRLDSNAVPAEYVLLPRTVDVSESVTAEQRRTAQHSEYEAWGATEKRLRVILRGAIEDLAWKADDPRRLKYVASATEQEIVHGALEPQDAAEHVFGFNRVIETNDGKPLAKNAPPDGSARSFLDETEINGRWVPDEEAHDRLGTLKDRLSALLGANISAYQATWTGSGITADHIGSLPDSLSACEALLEKTDLPNTLCNDVWRNLAEVIVAQLHELDAVDMLERETSAHRRYGDERSRHFVGRDEVLDAIERYTKSNERTPIALVGAPGSGKSALVAKAAERVRAAHPAAVSVVRFIGATPASSDGRSLLSSLCREISRAYKADESDIPGDSNALAVAFGKKMELATAGRPLILFLDAIDRLGETDPARNLAWLPARLPEHVHLVVSVAPAGHDGPLRDKRPSPEFIDLGPMQPAEGAKLLGTWLAQDGRTLQEHQLHEVLSKFAATGLPLYLRLAFEEARLWNSYTPASETSLPHEPEALVDRLLTRLSRRSAHGPVLVSHALGYLAGARDGLTEDELLDVLSGDDGIVEGVDGSLQVRYQLPDGVLADLRTHARHELKVKRLPDAPWSRLLLDLEPYLTRRQLDDGLVLSFANRLVADVVRERFLDDSVRVRRYRVLAGYFLGKPTTRRVGNSYLPNLHVFSELPHHLARAEMWPELVEVLVDPVFFSVSCDLGYEYELMYYWQQVRGLAERDRAIPGRVHIDIADLYRQALAKVDEPARFATLGRLGQFLRMLGLPEAAEECLREEREYLARGKKPVVDESANLNEQGLALLDRGKPERALAMFDEARRVIDGLSIAEVDREAAMGAVLMNMARANEALGNLGEADVLIRRARDCIQTSAGPESPQMATVLQTMGNFASERGRAEDALDLHRQAYRVRRSALGEDHFDVGLSLYNLGRLEVSVGRFTAGTSHVEEALGIFTQHVGTAGPEARQARDLLSHCSKLASKAEAKPSGFGLALLLLNAQPSTEDAPDPRQSAGAERVARAVTDELVSRWDDMQAEGSAIPIIVLGCPGFEGVVRLAIAQASAAKIPTKLLRWVELPPIDATRDSRENAMLVRELDQRRSDVAAWAESWHIRMLMARPIGNVGAMVNRALLQDLGTDERVVSFDSVPIDGLDGPLVGVSTASGERLPGVIPTHDWKTQGYVPRDGDSRATGTFYINIPGAEKKFGKRGAGPRGNALDDWALGALIALAIAPYKGQNDAFENELMGLIGLSRACPINCPSELGRRGIGRVYGAAD